ncbi:uncharacterized protein DNG_01602 [Cephalotrichum gorgonifer]|uniref:Uncharacterized protein n=1 Tax=Cephalotrichum gorgonifer TaxID=2041049 RepID=A0AAE8SSF4_9PEZI|nr:uncharacterized protein DNG_01602 [Cephalotrichum gorgonifer]
MAVRHRNEVCDSSIDPSSRKWGQLATDVKDSAACVAQCKERFMGQVAAVAQNDDTAGALCEALNSTAGFGADLGFGWLYCCDSVLCGVWFDRERRATAHDPNVKRIVYECQNQGYEGVEDSGLPPDEFTCPQSSVYAPNEPAACLNIVGSMDFKHSLSSTLSAPSSASTTGPAPSPSVPSHPPPADIAPSQDSTVPPAQSRPVLSTGIKAAIGVVSFLAFLTLLSIAFYLLRRRRHPPRTKYRDSIRERIKHASVPPSPSSSPTRLVPARTHSPAGSRPQTVSTPLSPPPRLKDRRLLPTLTSSPARSPHHAHPVPTPFPTNPICAPTTSKLVPRNENAPLPPFMPAGKPCSSTSTHRSASSAPAGSQRSGPPSGEGPPPSEQLPPTRPPRPHDGPLEIPDLVTPGPPPMRALPATPLPPPAGPRADMGIGVAVSRDPLDEEAPDGDRDLADKYARGRASWGSWGTRVASPDLGEEGPKRMGRRCT